MKSVLKPDWSWTQTSFLTMMSSCVPTLWKLSTHPFCKTSRLRRGGRGDEWMSQEADPPEIGVVYVRRSENTQRLDEPLWPLLCPSAGHILVTGATWALFLFADFVFSPFFLVQAHLKVFI